MECFKSVLDKLTDVHQKMGNMPSFRTSSKKLEVTKDPPSGNNDSFLPDWMEDTRVAMDYSEGYGRIIKDENEIRALKRNTRPATRLTLDSNNFDILQQGIHLTQKYYHKNVSRPDAERKLHATKRQGAWMLRDSERRKGALFIAYYCDDRVHHIQVKVATYNDPYTGLMIYVVTTDTNLAFRDVNSLIEYYRLNKGADFHCILGESLKNPNQRDDSPPRMACKHQPLNVDPKVLKRASSAKSGSSGGLFSGFQKRGSSSKSKKDSSKSGK